MWLFRSLRVKDHAFAIIQSTRQLKSFHTCHKQCHMQYRVSVKSKCNVTWHNKFGNELLFRQLNLQGKVMFLQRKFLASHNSSQYEYDPNTDSFRPKDQISFTHSKQQNQQEQNNKQGFKTFLLRFSKNLFLLTGGIVWIGAVFVTLFVDVKEEDILSNDIRDFDDEIRHLAFYDIGQTKTDLAKMMSKERNYKEISDIQNSTNRKQISFQNTIKWLQKHDSIVESLGEPVHLCGFRAANKISQMITSFQHLAEHGIKDHLNTNVTNNKWRAECIIEGKNGLALLILDFERKDSESDWVPVYVKVSVLDPAGINLLEQNSPLPYGVLPVNETI